jgi:hypothetical protein
MARLQIPGGCYQVISQWHQRRAIFEIGAEEPG